MIGALVEQAGVNLRGRLIDEPGLAQQVKVVTTQSFLGMGSGFGVGSMTRMCR